MRTTFAQVEEVLLRGDYRTAEHMYYDYLDSIHNRWGLVDPKEAHGMKYMSIIELSLNPDKEQVWHFLKEEVKRWTIREFADKFGTNSMNLKVVEVLDFSMMGFHAQIGYGMSIYVEYVRQVEHHIAEFPICCAPPVGAGGIDTGTLVGEIKKRVAGWLKSRFNGEMARQEIEQFCGRGEISLKEIMSELEEGE